MENECACPGHWQCPTRIFPASVNAMWSQATSSPQSWQTLRMRNSPLFVVSMSTSLMGATSNISGKGGACKSTITRLAAQGRPTSAAGSYRLEDPARFSTWVGLSWPTTASRSRRRGCHPLRSDEGLRWRFPRVALFPTLKRFPSALPLPAHGGVLAPPRVRRLGGASHVEGFSTTDRGSQRHGCALKQARPARRGRWPRGCCRLRRAGLRHRRLLHRHRRLLRLRAPLLPPRNEREQRHARRVVVLQRHLHRRAEPVVEQLERAVQHVAGARAVGLRRPLRAAAAL